MIVQNSNLATAESQSASSCTVSASQMEESVLPSEIALLVATHTLMKI